MTVLRDILQEAINDHTSPVYGFTTTAGDYIPYTLEGDDPFILPAPLDSLNSHIIDVHLFGTQVGSLERYQFAVDGNFTGNAGTVDLWGNGFMSGETSSADYKDIDSPVRFYFVKLAAGNNIILKAQIQSSGNWITKSVFLSDSIAGNVPAGTDEPYIAVGMKDTFIRFSMVIPKDPAKRVSSIQVAPQIVDSTGILQVTDIMLQAGTLSTIWAPNPTELRWQYDAIS